MTYTADDARQDLADMYDRVCGSTENREAVYDRLLAYIDRIEAERDALAVEVAALRIRNEELDRMATASLKHSSEVAVEAMRGERDE